MKQKINFTPVFEKTGYVYTPTYYYLKTGIIPSVIYYNKIHVRKLFERIVQEYELLSDKIIKVDSYNNILEKSRVQSASIELSDSLILFLNNFRSEVELYYSPSTPVKEIERIESIIIEHVRHFTEEKKIGLIVSDSNGTLDIREFTVTDLNEDISALYNEDFLEFNSLLIDKLQRRLSHGLVLLHGIPGTGKSSYLKHLIGKVKKNFIYLPSNMADRIAQPNFISFLTKHSNSILIIEDAEDVLMQRKAGSKSAVANLLNLSDGLLSDCLRIQVIATFNSDIGKIDEAFLRKGRIIGRYNFEALSTVKSNSLLRQLESLHETDKPMTLAEIFNYQDQDFGKVKNRNEIGFAMNGKEDNK